MKLSKNQSIISRFLNFFKKNKKEEKPLWEAKIYVCRDINVFLAFSVHPDLCCEGTTQEEAVAKLHDLLERYFHENK